MWTAPLLVGLMCVFSQLQVLASSATFIMGFGSELLAGCFRMAPPVLRWSLRYVSSCYPTGGAHDLRTEPQLSETGLYVLLRRAFKLFWYHCEPHRSKVPCTRGSKATPNPQILLHLSRWWCLNYFNLLWEFVFHVLFCYSPKKAQREFLGKFQWSSEGRPGSAAVGLNFFLTWNWTLICSEVFLCCFS